MNCRRLVLLFAVLAVAGAAWSWRLRGERAALGQEAASLRAAVPVAAAPTPQPEAPWSLTRAEQDELLELRGRLAELLRRQRELAARPAAPPAASRRTPDQGAELRRRLGLPADYRLATELTVEGYASPAAAFASLIAGARARDTNAVLAALVPPLAQELAQAIQSSGVDILGENFGAAPGFRVLSEDLDRGGRGLLEVEIMPGLPPMKFRAIRDGEGNWRLDPGEE